VYVVVSLVVGIVVEVGVGVGVTIAIVVRIVGVVVLDSLSLIYRMDLDLRSGWGWLLVNTNNRIRTVGTTVVMCA